MPLEVQPLQDGRKFVQVEQSSDDQMAEKVREDKNLIIINYIGFGANLHFLNRRRRGRGEKVAEMQTEGAPRVSIRLH